jgi:hypothetical protein
MAHRANQSVLPQDGYYRSESGSDGLAAASALRRIHPLAAYVCLMISIIIRTVDRPKRLTTIGLP